MLFILTIVLLSASVAMALLLYAKHWELTRNRLIMAPVRPALSKASLRFITLTLHRAPRMGHRVARAAVLWTRAHTRDMVAHVLISVEHALEAALMRLKHAFSPAAGATGAASSTFLREVAEQRQKLTRVTRVRRTARAEDATGSERSKESNIVPR